MTAENWQYLWLGRADEKEALKEACNRVQGVQGSELVILLGESGFGKTRLLQWFYSWLSTESDKSKYWPDILPQDGMIMSINPSFPNDRFPSEEIPWLWWGIRSTNPTDRNKREGSGCMLTESANLIMPHLAPIVREKEKKSVKSQAVKLAIKGFLQLFWPLNYVGEMLEFIENIKEAKLSAIKIANFSMKLWLLFITISVLAQTAIVW